MKQRVLTNWSLIRAIRLLMGAGAVAQGILQEEPFLLIAGSFILVGAMLNYGCCGNSCPVSYSGKKDIHMDTEKVNTQNKRC